MELTVLSHAYVEPTNRGKLRELSRFGPVTVVVPRRWRERTLRREWCPIETDDGEVRVVAARWLGAPHPSLGVMLVPRGLSVGSRGVLQLEEEPWTPSAHMAARRWSGPIVLFTWENLLRALPPPWSWMRRRVLSRVQGVIAGSQGAAGVIAAEGYTGPVDVIPQLGIDLPQVVGREPPGERLRILFVGRLVRAKGVDLLLEAAGRLACRWTLTVIGDGPERPRLERLARQIGIGETVIFRGARPHGDVAAAWSDADVCVLPSRTTRSWAEQFGHVLVEAMAHRVAVLGSTCGAIPEVIGNAGMVFPEGSSGALASALLTLAERPDQLRELAELGWRRVAAHFTNERLAARTHAFHQQVLASVSAAHR